MKTVIVGINWGDEGKGRMVDLLAEQYDIVVRYQGGNNAGHTVVNQQGQFVLNLLPSGILRPETVNVMGPGMVVDIEHLAGEMERLRASGVDISPGHLLISDKATICMPYHKQLDGLEEDRLGDAKFGSTRRGIAPCYADKYMKKSLRMEDLRAGDDYLLAKLNAIAEWKNIALSGYQGQLAEGRELLAWLRQYGEPLLPLLADSGAFLRQAAAENKSILFEAQLGALRDIDFGIYPYTTSSNTLAAYAPLGSGAPGLHYDRVVGVIKAYSSCVGEGPFTAELFGAAGDALREAGGEYGAATGRPRRVGPLDLVASAYGVELQGADALALTKLDVLSYLEQIPVCTAYRVEGRETTAFPSGPQLLAAEPVLEYRPGFNCDISHCRSWQQLPQAARDYVEYIEARLNCPIKYVSVGAERQQIIYR